MVSFVQEVGAAAMRWLLSGHLYAVNTLNASLASGGSMNMVIQNPSDSGKYLLITYMEVGSDGQGTLNIYLDASISDAGTAITPVTLKRPNGNTPTFQASTGATFTAGSETLSFNCSGGEGRRSVGSKNGLRPAIVLGPGESVVIEFVNRAASTVQAHLYAEVYEADLGQS